MATEDEDTTGKRKFLVIAAKTVAVITLLLVLPIAVAFNLFGIADRLSPLPGITDGGGAIAGVVTLVYISIALGVATAGGIVMMGAEFPFVASPGPETAEPMPTATPNGNSTSAPTFTPITPQTSNATPSTEEIRETQLEEFREGYLARVGSTTENESLTGVPVIGSEYREKDDGELELWVVFWECDFPQSQDEQWLTLGNDVVNTAGPHEGAQPDRVRIYAVTNLTHFEDEITYIKTEEAETAYNESLDGETYTQNWWNRRHEPTQAENDTAYRIVVEDSGQDIAETAFLEDHADNDKASCNGGAKPAEGTDDRQEHKENTNAVDAASVPPLN